MGIFKTELIVIIIIFFLNNSNNNNNKILDLLCISDHLLQLGLDVLLLRGRDTNVLDFLLVLQEWRRHDVSQHERVGLHVKLVVGQVGDAVPMPLLHRLVGHELQNGTALIEVVNGLLEVQKGPVLLEALGQLAAPVPEMGNCKKKVI